MMSALAGRRGSGRWAGVARLGCSATRFERATVEAKSSKDSVRRLHCVALGASRFAAKRKSRTTARSAEAAAGEEAVEAVAGVDAAAFASVMLGWLEASAASSPHPKSHTSLHALISPHSAPSPKISACPAPCARRAAFEW